MKLKVALCASVLTLGLADAAAAQSFLENLARAAVRGAVDGSRGGAAPNGSAASLEAGSTLAAGAATGAPASTQALFPSAFPDLAPINYEPSMYSPIQMRFVEHIQTGKMSFDAFNARRCSDCEGSETYDSWIRHMVPEYRANYALEQKIDTMAIGEAVRWHGRSGARLALTVVGDEPVGRWECKQVRWTSERGGESAQRLGLFCNDNEDRDR